MIGDTGTSVPRQSASCSAGKGQGFLRVAKTVFLDAGMHVDPVWADAPYRLCNILRLESSCEYYRDC